VTLIDALAGIGEKPGDRICNPSFFLVESAVLTWALGTDVGTSRLWRRSEALVIVTTYPLLKPADDQVSPYGRVRFWKHEIAIHTKRTKLSRHE